MPDQVPAKTCLPDDVRWEHHDKNVEVLLRKNSDFVVYLDHSFEVDWEDTPEYDDLLEKAKIEVGKIHGRITCLEAIPVNHLNKQICRAFRCILGEAMCLALEQDIKGAQLLLTKAEEFVTARNHEHARGWYASASAVSTVTIIALTGVIAAIYLWWNPVSEDAKLNILAVGIAGAVGALFSILLRVGHAPVDPSAGAMIHYLEGAARIVVGVVGALIVVAAIRAGLFLPQLTNPYGIVLACVVAGASERMASGIIEKVEGAWVRNADKPKHSEKSKS